MKIVTVLIGVVLLCGLSFFVYQRNVESQQHSTLKTHQYNIALGRVAQLEIDKQQELVRLAELEQQLKGAPAAIVTEVDHDFGIMNPFTEGEHRFVIRNDGDGPLQLKKGGKTCHCVGFELLQSIVLPGETAEILVQWDTKYPTDEFRHGATVDTNDELNPEIKFRVNGKVRTILGASDDVFLFDRVIPGQSMTRQQIIFSQIWDEFEIVETKLTLPGATIEFRPATTDELARLEAKSGFAVAVTIPENMETGDYSGYFAQLKVVPKIAFQESEYPAKSRTMEIEIRGRVINRLSVYDKGVATRTVKFTDLTAGVGGTKRLLMRVNDEIGRLNATSIVTEPEFVKASVSRLGSSGNSGGAIYYLDVEIPGDGVDVRNDSNPGKIKISFDHPRIKLLELDLTFTVIN